MQQPDASGSAPTMRSVAPVRAPDLGPGARAGRAGPCAARAGRRRRCGARGRRARRRRDEHAVRDDLVLAGEPALRRRRAPSRRRRCGGRAGRRGSPTRASRSASSRGRRSRGTCRPSAPAHERERGDARRRRHRLVQVQDVEALALERRADAEDRARAEDDVRERAVRGHDHRAADRDHVRRRVAVAAVPRVQHARELAGRVVAHDRLHLVARGRRSASAWSSACSTTAPQKDHEYGTTMPTFIAAIIVGGPGAPPFAPRPARSSGSRCPRSARSPRSRSTSSSTPRSSAISGAPQIAALGLAGTVLAGAFTIFNFLTYGTTAVVARASGAGQHERGRPARGAGALGSRSGSASRCSSCCETVARAAAARARRRTGARATTRSSYFRIAAIGLPAALVALAGQGYLRGVSNLRRPLEIVVVANLANLVLEVALRLRLPLGDRRLGGRDGDRAGRDGRRLRRRAAAAARAVAATEPARDAADGARSAGRSSCARRRCTRRSSSPRRCSRAWATRELGAHQIAYQLFLFLALRPRRGRDRGPGDRRADARRRRRRRRATRPRCG